MDMRRLAVPLLLVAATLAVVGTAGVTLRGDRQAPERGAAPPPAQMKGGSGGSAAATAPPHPPHSPEVRELLYHLRFGSNRKRRLVALRLAELGPAAASAVPELVEFLTHEGDWWGRVRPEMGQAPARSASGPRNPASRPRGPLG